MGRPKKVKEPRYCIRCESLLTSRYQKKYCSKTCSNEARITRVEKPCKVCEKPTKNPEYCSRSCSAKINNTKYPKRSKESDPRECLACGSLTYNDKYCSIMCYSEARRIKPSGLRECLTCESLTYNDRYCSRECSVKGWDEKFPLSEVMVENSTYARNNLRRRILNDNLLEYVCAICSIPPEWQGKPMPLILDHINGVNNDHRIENLRFVCSNCDSQLDTYRGKNCKNKGRVAESGLLHWS